MIVVFSNLRDGKWYPASNFTGNREMNPTKLKVEDLHAKRCSPGYPANEIQYSQLQSFKQQLDQILSSTESGDASGSCHSSRLNTNESPPIRSSQESTSFELTVHSGKGYYRDRLSTGQFSQPIKLSDSILSNNSSLNLTFNDRPSKKPPKICVSSA